MTRKQVESLLCRIAQACEHDGPHGLEEIQEDVEMFALEHFPELELYKAKGGE